MYQHFHTPDVDEALRYLDGRVRQVFDAGHNSAPRFGVTDANMVRRLLVHIQQADRFEPRGVTTAR